MLMDLTYLLLNKVNITEIDSLQLNLLKDFSQAELEIITKNLSDLGNNPTILASSSWKI